MPRNEEVLVVFSHGKESGPMGSKIQALLEIALAVGAQAISVDYRGLDTPEARLEHLFKQTLPECECLVLVGSSMGGYVSAVASRTLKPAGLFLMAPAFGMANYPEHMPEIWANKVCVVHGWGDDVVSPAASFEFAERNKADLHMVADDHRLSRSISHLKVWFGELLREVRAS